MYNQDGFFFFLLKEASPGCPGACGGHSPHHCLAPSHPARWDRDTRGRGRSQVRGSFWGVRWDGVILLNPPGSAERLGRVREDGPCPKNSINTRDHHLPR